MLPPKKQLFRNIITPKATMMRQPQPRTSSFFVTGGFEGAVSGGCVMAAFGDGWRLWVVRHVFKRQKNYPPPRSECFRTGDRRV